MRQIKVKVLTTNNLHISGNLTLTMLQDRHLFQVSEVLNTSRSFIELTDVEVHDKNQELMVKMPLLCLNKPVIASLFQAESSQDSLSPQYSSHPKTSVKERDSHQQQQFQMSFFKFEA